MATKKVEKAIEDSKKAAEATKAVVDKAVEKKTAEVKEVADAVKEVKKASKAVTKKVVEQSVNDVKEATEAVKAATEEVAKKAKKTTTKKEIKTSVYVEYAGKQVDEKDMIASVKKDWTKASGKKVGDIKNIALYVKPEDGAVYYVVNGKDTGKVEF